MRENIKNFSRDGRATLLYNEKHKPWFNEQAKLTVIGYEPNMWDNLNNIRHEAKRHFTHK
jgi:hypothetical protein